MLASCAFRFCGPRCPRQLILRISGSRRLSKPRSHSADKSTRVARACIAIDLVTVCILDFQIWRLFVRSCSTCSWMHPTCQASVARSEPLPAADSQSLNCRAPNVARRRIGGARWGKITFTPPPAEGRTRRIAPPNRKRRRI